MPQFRSVCIVTADVQRLRRFYTAILGCEARGDERFVELTGAGIGLSISSVHVMDSMAPGSTDGAGAGRIVLEFEVPDVDAVYTRLHEMGVPIIKPPTTQPWGLRSLWFRDPDGHIVNFFCHAAAQATP
jgi:catechol 2,3-dioxygenase-like lactoylglutathione lyase family enzyme